MSKRNKNRFRIVAIAATVIVTGSIFYSCEKLEWEASGNKMMSIQTTCNESIFTHSISIADFKSIIPLLQNRLHTKDGDIKEYAVFSFDKTSTDIIKYGFVNEIEHPDFFKKWIENLQMVGECQDSIYEFDDAGTATDFALDKLEDGCLATIWEEGSKWLVHIKPDPIKSLPPLPSYNNVLKCSIDINNFDKFNVYMMQHHLVVLGNYAVFSVDDEDKNILRYGYFTEAANPELFQFLSRFAELGDDGEPLMMGTGDQQPENKISTTDREKVKKFVKEEGEKGNVITISYHDRDKVYTATSWKK
jgi:hypothetical protein